MASNPKLPTKVTLSTRITVSVTYHRDESESDKEWLYFLRQLDKPGAPASYLGDIIETEHLQDFWEESNNQVKVYKSYR